PYDRGLGRFFLENQLRAFSAPLFDSFVRTVGAVMLVRAVGPQHVRRPHSAQAAMVTVLRRAGGIVRRQVVKRRRDSGLVEVVPERDALPSQPGRRRLMVERP